MFGIPLETITLLASTFIGFYMKFKAQQAADQTALLKASIERDKFSNMMMNDAAKRSSPFARKFIAFFIITVAFGMLAVAPFFEIPVTVIEKIPQKSFLFGLIKWGKTHAIISAEGFVIVDYVRYGVNAVLGLFLGSGAGKAAR